MERKENRLPIFTERFRSLQSDRTNTEFADFLGLSRQTVGFYCNGDRLPDVITLRQIAKKCNVTADWLLGLTDVAAPESDKRSICDYTGLNEDSIEFLHTFIADRDEDGVYPAGFTDEIYNPKRFVNDLLSEHYLDPFFTMVEFCDGINEMREQWNNTELLITEAKESANHVRGHLIQRLSHNTLARLKIEYAKSLFSSRIDFIVYEHEQKMESSKSNDNFAEGDKLQCQI